MKYIGWICVILYILSLLDFIDIKVSITNHKLGIGAVSIEEKK